MAPGVLRASRRQPWANADYPGTPGRLRGTGSLAMTYSLDTDSCLRCLNLPRSASSSTLATIPVPDIVVCSVVRAELHFGALRSRSPVVALNNLDQFLRPLGTAP